MSRIVITEKTNKMILNYLGEELDSTIAHEIFSDNEFGFKVTITYAKDSWISIGHGSHSDIR